MASQTDGSSVDENLSSVGESTWDLVDEASVVSEDAISAPQQGSQTIDEGMESVHLTNESFSRSGEVISTPSEVSEFNDVLPPNAQFQGIDTSQATPRVSNQEASRASLAVESVHSQDYRGNLRMDKVLKVNDFSGITIAYTNICTFDEKGATAPASTHLSHESAMPPTGRVHMGLKDGGLDVKDTFKLLYFGPKEMKSAITQKIGLALAANPCRVSTSDGPGSARVTVVPISSFVDDSSPEVVMIESGGFDMVIEECTGTRQQDLAITLELESGGTLDAYSCPKYTNDTQTDDIGHRRPDLSILYLPERSYSSDEAVPKDFRKTVHLLQSFLVHQKVPFYIITDLDWFETPKLPHCRMEMEVPHRSVVSLVFESQTSLKHMPIDINTFLALDAAQLHQNLVALKAQHLHGLHMFQKTMHPWTYWMESARKELTHFSDDAIARAQRLSPAAWMSIALLLLALISGSFLSSTTKQEDRTHLEPAPVNTPPKPIETFSLPKPRVTKGYGGLQAIPTAKALGDLFAKEPTQRPTGVHARKKAKHGKETPTSKEPEPQRSVLVRVVGESHILIKSSKPNSGQNQLQFESKRKGKKLEHNLQEIENGYYVLEIPPVDAYGLIEIRIWSTTKPVYNETFEIDLGFPWFNVKGWKEMAEEALEKTATEAQALQEQFWDSLKQSGAAYEEFKQSESVTQLVEKVRTSMQDLDRAARSGSSELIQRSLQNSMRLRKRLYRTMLKLQRSSARQSHAAREQQKRVNKELTDLYRIMETTLASQRLQFERALRALQKRFDTQRLSKTRERQLRRVQKSLLRAWWKVGGRPEGGKSKKRR